MSKSLLKRCGFFIVTLAAAACASASGPKYCGDEYRGVEGVGDAALADGLSFVRVRADLGERRKPGRPETQTARVQLEVYSHLLSDPVIASDFLRGHITTVEVRDAGTPRLIKSYVPPNPPLPFLYDFSQDGVYDWSITVDDARALFLADQVVIELRTDRTSQPLVRVPLKRSDVGDPLQWSRTMISGGHC